MFDCAHMNESTSGIDYSIGWCEGKGEGFGKRLAAQTPRLHRAKVWSLQVSDLQ
jgi:hypothetical protein